MTNTICNPLPDFETRTRTSKKQRIAQLCSALSRTSSDNVRWQIEDVVNHLTVKEFDLQLALSREFEKHLCSHAAVIALLKPSLASSFAVVLHNTPPQFHDLIVSTLDTSGSKHWSEYIMHFLLQVEADGLERAVTEALERVEMPVFGRTSGRGNNTNHNCKLVKEFLLHVVTNEADSDVTNIIACRERSRALAMKWLPYFTETDDECRSVIDVSAYKDPLVRALAAVHCRSLNWNHPLLVETLWGHLETLNWSAPRAPLSLPFQKVDDRETDESRVSSPPHAVEKLIANGLVSIIHERFPQEQLEKLSAEYAQKWFGQIGSGKPCDRDKVESGLTKLYASAGAKPPQAVLWFDNPIIASVAGALYATSVVPGYSSDAKFPTYLSGTKFDNSKFSQVAKYVRGIEGQIEAVPFFSKVCASNWDFGRRSAWATHEYESDLIQWCGTPALRMPPPRGRDFWDIVSSQAEDDGINQQDATTAWHKLRDGLKHTKYAGLFEQSVPKADDFSHRTLSAFFDRSRLKAVGYRAMLNEIGMCPYTDDGLEDILSNCAGFIPLDDCVLVLERPTTIIRNQQNRLHNASGFSITYGDGWGVCSLNGIRVPRRIVFAKETITVEEIERNYNMEMRRVMIDAYGLERFLADSKAELVNEDRFGKLYYKKVSDWSGHAFLRVVNSTAEPDGTFNEYFLEVPRTMRTAHEAVAWTFAMTPEEYDPLVET